MDILTISRRLGHGSAAITLAVYSHLIAGSDSKAAYGNDVRWPANGLSTKGAGFGWQSGGNFSVGVQEVQ